jgi:hypothetical protein
MNRHTGRYSRWVPIARSIGTPREESVRGRCERVFVTRDRVHDLLREGLSRKEIAIAWA